MIDYSRGLYAIVMGFSLLQSCNHVVHQGKDDPNSPQGSALASGSANQAHGSTSQNGLLLLAAVENGNVTTVADLLTKVNLNEVKDGLGNTPLHLVENLQIAQMVIAAKAYLDAKNSQEWTPLYTATHRNHIDIMDALIQAGADVNSSNDWLWTPLHAAVQSGHLAAMQKLIDHKADLHAEANLGFSMQDGKITPLHLAALFGKVEALKLLIDCFDPKDREAALNAPAICGFTPLDMAALSCNENFRALFPDSHLKKFFSDVADASACIRYLEDSGADKKVTNSLRISYQTLKIATKELAPLAGLFQGSK